MTPFVKKLLSWIIAFLIALGLTCLVAYYELVAVAPLFREIDFSLKRRLCDGSFVAAVAYLSVGGLIGISEHGGLDALRYATWKLKERILHPKVEDREDNQTYYDYVKAREEREKVPFAFILVVGALSLCVSIILALA